jgi:hypothetical protein
MHGALGIDKELVFFREAVGLFWSLDHLLFSRRYDFRYIGKPKTWLGAHEGSLYKKFNRLTNLTDKQTMTSKF